MLYHILSYFNTFYSIYHINIIKSCYFISYINPGFLKFLNWPHKNGPKFCQTKCLNLKNVTKDVPNINRLQYLSPTSSIYRHWRPASTPSKTDTNITIAEFMKPPELKSINIGITSAIFTLRIQSIQTQCKEGASDASVNWRPSII